MPAKLLAFLAGVGFALVLFLLVMYAILRRRERVCQAQGHDWRPSLLGLECSRCHAKPEDDRADPRHGRLVTTCV